MCTWPSTAKPPSTVALKLIEHGPDADTRDAIEAERRGAQLQARLAAIDPHVVRVYQSGDLDGFFFVAMEFIDGRDWHEWMRGGPLTPEFASEVAQAVAETLDHAHNLDVDMDGKPYHGIVHGDIKPKNIRIGNRAEVRVLDFGIAKALSLSRRLTRNEFGSVPYASPERLDSGDVDVQSDLWALAVMLYEMVTGLQPYHAATTERLENMIRSRIPPPPAPDPCPEAVAPHPGARHGGRSGGAVPIGAGVRPGFGRFPRRIFRVAGAMDRRRMPPGCQRWPGRFRKKMRMPRAGPPTSPAENRTTMPPAAPGPKP